MPYDCSTAASDGVMPGIWADVILNEMARQEAVLLRLAIDDQHVLQLAVGGLIVIGLGLEFVDGSLERRLPLAMRGRDGRLSALLQLILLDGKLLA